MFLLQLHWRWSQWKLFQEWSPRRFMEVICSWPIPSSTLCSSLWSYHVLFRSSASQHLKTHTHFIDSLQKNGVHSVYHPQVSESGHEDVWRHWDCAHQLRFLHCHRCCCRFNLIWYVLYTLCLLYIQCLQPPSFLSHFVVAEKGLHTTLTHTYNIIISGFLIHFQSHKSVFLFYCRVCSVDSCPKIISSSLR